MGVSPAVSRKSFSPSPSPAPRNGEDYARLLDRALAARYLQELLTRRHNAAGKLRAAAPLTQTANQMLMPRLDLCQCASPDGTTSQVIATFELPGLKRADLHLEVRSGWLIVEGERRRPGRLHSRAPAQHPRLTASGGDAAMPAKPSSPHSLSHLLVDESSGPKISAVTKKDEEHGSHHISEIRYGHFRRMVQLPHGIESKDIDANLVDGMLVVSWPSSSSAGTGDTVPVGHTNSI